MLALIATAFSEDRPVFARGDHIARHIPAAGAAGRIDPRYRVNENFEHYKPSPPGE